MPALTLKQENFADIYLKIGNASEAYRRAYNAENMGQAAINIEAKRLIDHPKIALRIDALKVQIQRHTVLDIGFVVGSFQEIYERSMQHHMVLDHKGEPTGEYQFNAAGANKAMENIGRLLGFYVDKSRRMIGSPQDYAEAKALQGKYDAMSLDELLALRDQRRALPSPQEPRTEE